MASYSIYGDLTRLPYLPASSTEIIDILIRSLAEEACRSIRGAQTYYRIVSRSREICEHIDDLMIEALGNKDWDKYDLCTSQIGPLEELLLQVSKATSEETETFLSLQLKSIPECLDSIKRWENTRKTYRDVSRRLHDKPFAVSYPWEDDIKAAIYHDDISWIYALCDAISNFPTPPSEKNRALNLRASFTDPAAKIQRILAESTSIEEPLMVFISRCFMVVYGIITVSSDSNIALHDRERLKSRRVSNATLRIIEGLQIVLLDSSCSLQNLLNDWAPYETQILKTTDEDINELLHLLNTSSARQLFHAQCLALARFCWDIRQAIKIAESADGVESLESCIDILSEAMELGATTANQIDKNTFNWSRLQETPASKTIHEASARICQMYNQFAMDLILRDLDTEMREALNKDKKVISLLENVVLKMPARVSGNDTSRTFESTKFDIESLGDTISLEDLSITKVDPEDKFTLSDIVDHIRRVEGLQIDPTAKTDLIALLIHSLPHTVSEMDKPQLYDLIIDRARVICSRVDTSIHEAIYEAKGTDWRILIVRINRLEELLYKLHDSIVESSSIAVPNDIGKYHETVELWERGRDIPLEVLQQLYVGPFDELENEAKPSIRSVSYNWDLERLRFVKEIITNESPKLISGHGISVPSDLVTYLIAQAHHILGQEQTSEDAVIALRIRYIIAIYIILSLSANESVDINVREHLKSHNTWEHLYAFVENLYYAIETSTFTPHLMTDWSEFEHYLLNPEHKLLGCPSLTPFDAADFTGHWEKLDQSPFATNTNGDIYKSQLIPGERSCEEKLVSVKVLRTIRISHGNVPGRITTKRIQREVQVWSQLDHNNVVTTLGYAFESGYPCLLAPWCENGNVLYYIGEHPNADRSQMIAEAINGLIYLHSYNPPVIHGNIKATNLLIDNEGHARLADFGFRRKLEVDHMGSATPSGSNGTNRWMAPELLHAERTQCTAPSDVYSLVHLALAIYAQKTPFSHLDELQFLMSMHNQESPQRSHYHPFNPPEELWEVFERGWSCNPEERPSADGFKNMFSEALGAKNWRCFFGPADLTGCWTKTEDSPYTTGGHSDIYKSKLHEGSHPHKEQMVAIKVLRLIRIRSGSIAAEILHKRLQREVQVWSRLDHRNIVPFLGFAFYGNSPCMVAPWYGNGAIPDYLREHPNVDRTQLASESIEGLVYLHTRKSPIIHGDLKASNILVDDEGHARITDFGLSRALQDGRTGLTTSSGVSGTYRWMAPELLIEENSLPTIASDVYALILLVVEIYTLKAPFPHLDQPKFFMHIYNQKSPERSHYDPFDPPEEIWSIFEKGWSFDPEKRPSALGVKSMFAEALEVTGWEFKS